MMTRNEFVERFRLQASPALSGNNLEKAIDVLCNIEFAEDISNVSCLLNGESND